jgi:polyphosphate kinase
MISLEEVKELILNETSPLKRKIQGMEEKLASFENNLQFYSCKYDDLLKQCQSVNKTLSGSTKENNDTKLMINSSKNQIVNLDRELKNTIKDLDDLKQYLRRDCIEVVGAKAKDAQECSQITIALAKDMGIVLEPNDISTAHPLPTPRGKNDKFIVKFTGRETKDKFYANRQKTAGRKPCNHQQSIMLYKRMTNCSYLNL